jgi:hypothetical protein
MMGNDWLTDELMQRAAKLIQDIDGIASQGSVYLVSRALYEAEKRGREEAAKIADDYERRAERVVPPAWEACATARNLAAAIRSGQ